MSLTSNIKRRTAIYELIKRHLDLEKCFKLIKHQNNKLRNIKHIPVKNTNYPLTGMSVIYAIRDHLLDSNDWWDSSVAGYCELYPINIPKPYRYIYMALLDKKARSKKELYIKKSLALGALTPTFNDVKNITEGCLPLLLSEFKGHKMSANPKFNLSNYIGGADANMIIDNSLIDIRTTAKQKPLDLDNIIQQIGYYLLDDKDEYNINSITWIYTRQECFFSHPLDRLLKNQLKAKEEFKELAIGLVGGRKALLR